MNDLRDRTGKWYISMTAVDTNPGFPKSFPLKQVFQTTWGRMTSSLLLWPLIWLIISNHSYLPGYMAAVSTLLILLGSFSCSRKVTRFSPETTSPVHQRKEYLCSERFIHAQPYMYSGETRMHGRMLIRPRKWFPQILYSKHIYNTNKYITIKSWDFGHVPLRQK